ncbi:putative membrane protein [Syntrophus gentianae]|uniref:Putative membrane protein n=1 Tax=Syntrophus gentianae TaxID=43775 RepID=A0A1H7YGW2_9BACT|nr:phage holin family protein [Syntrophus gentianae]SEM45462.1 putative membrane protein [Syntrophus gentianae]
MRFLIKWLILTLSVLLVAYLLEGIKVSGFFSALMAAAMLGFLNVFFRPILLVLTLPVNLLSLGLFTFLINALILKMASGVISGFEVQGFWTAVFGALLISIVNGLLNAFLSKGNNEGGGGGNFIDLRKRGRDRWA